MVSRAVQFRFTLVLTGNNSAKIHQGVVSLYRKAGFKVTTALMDGEFVPLCSGLAELGLRLNETSRHEHVGDIEQYICTVKERMCVEIIRLVTATSPVPAGLRTQHLANTFNHEKLHECSRPKSINPLDWVR